MKITKLLQKLKKLLCGKPEVKAEKKLEVEKVVPLKKETVKKPSSRKKP